MFQFVIASLPVFVFLVYLLYTAVRFQFGPCSGTEFTWGVDDDLVLAEQRNQCAGLQPMFDILVVFLGICLPWSILGVYLSFFVKRRHQLIDLYLKNGETIIGDVFFDEKSIRPTMTYHGSVTYLHPANQRLPVYIRKQIRIFEQFSRENTTLLLLPGRPFSGQSKSDLEIDQTVSARNLPLLQKLASFCWYWVAFTLCGAAYVLFLMNIIHPELDYQRDVDEQIVNIAALFYTFIVLPCLSYLVNWVAWRTHYKWMVRDYKILEKDEPVGSTGSCCNIFTWFNDLVVDDTNEEISSVKGDYKPPGLKKPIEAEMVESGLSVASDGDTIGSGSTGRDDTIGSGSTGKADTIGSGSTGK